MQINCIIKNTKTVDEFKRVRASMEERAERYSRRHIASCEHWQDALGNTRKLKLDLNGINKGSAFCTSLFLLPAGKKCTGLLASQSPRRAHWIKPCFV